MKRNSNNLKPVKQYILIGIIVLITLFGLTLKANAQSTTLGNDLDKINNGMTIKLVDYNFDIIIPKITAQELEKIQDALFNQMVYVTDGAAGYYFHMGAKWEMQDVREVFELIDLNLRIQSPSPASIIVVSEGSNSKNLLDFNDHVKRVYHGFSFDTNDNSMAISMGKK